MNKDIIHLHCSHFVPLTTARLKSNPEMHETKPKTIYAKLLKYERF